MSHKNKPKYSFVYIDSIGEEHTINFHKWEYNNVMELLWDRTIEDWGDCKGRAWCGTCQVNILKSKIELIEYDSTENHCLSNQENRVKTSRLACQIELTAALDRAVLKYLGDT